MLSATKTLGCSVGRKLLLLTILLLCSAVTYVVPAAAQNYTVIHNFGGQDFPNAGVTLNVPAINLYGNAGEQTVYRMRKMGANWLFFSLYEFNGVDGEQPDGRVTLGADGTVYGASQLGGLFECGNQDYGCGLIFHLRPSIAICKTSLCYWTETPIYQFDPVNHPGDGY